MSVTSLPVGTQLRDWRTRRRLSQMELAMDAEVSTRHLSFVETGRAQPSRDLILRLSEQLQVPLRERNALLLAGGFAPVYGERSLESPDLAAAREAVQRILTGHEPYPAIAVDRHWDLLAFNQAVGPLLTGIDPVLLEPPVNMLRLTFHPRGLAPLIENLGEWRAHQLQRLDRQIAHTGDRQLEALRAELTAYPAPDSPEPETIDPLLTPLVVRLGDRSARFFHTTTVFGLPTEITLSELAIESFFPADGETARHLQSLASAQS